MQLSLQLYGQLDLINYANNMAEVDTKINMLADKFIASGDPEKVSLGNILKEWKENIPTELLWADIAPIEKIEIILKDWIN